MNKKIGIVGWKIGENSFGVTIPYMEFFSQFGDVEIISATETNIRKHLDLVVLPGGPDVGPDRYDAQSLSYRMGTQCPFRERFDRVLLPKYIANNTPLWGICRGHQSLAVYFGGKLNQDMFHSTNGSNRAELVHELKLTPRLNDLLPDNIRFYNNHKNGKYVNSIHHQSVFLTEELKSVTNVLAYCEEDDSVEILEYTNYPAITVQYHPEEMYCKISTDLIINLLKYKENDKENKINLVNTSIKN